jgi:hypothetical protein
MSSLAGKKQEMNVKPSTNCSFGQGKTIPIASEGLV